MSEGPSKGRGGTARRDRLDPGESLSAEVRARSGGESVSGAVGTGTGMVALAAGFGVLSTLFIHAIVGFVVVQALGQMKLAAAGGGAAGDGEIVEMLLCEGRRCPFIERGFGRRDLDTGPSPEIDFIAVDLVPRLGLMEPDVKAMPELVKYEQPEIIEEAVNIKEELVVEDVLPRKEPKPRKPERDKRRKKVASLSDILDAPRDEDPRKRPRKLDKIIGVEGGSTFGTESTGREVDAVMARIRKELTKRFNVPTSLSDDKLKKLRFKAKLTVEANGSISQYKVVRRSGDRAYDNAAEATIKKFVPAEGGSARLPSIPADVRTLINSGKYVFVLDGKYLRR